MWNAGSLHNKLGTFTDLIDDEDIDIAAVTETWMTSQHNHITAELRDKGYGIYHFNREIKKGGGVALIYKNHFKFIKGKSFSRESFECILVSLASPTSRQVNFIVVYRFCEVAPTLFYTEFYDFIENIFITLKNCVILGDFNLHVNETFNPLIAKFSNILASFNLNQFVVGPTHKLGNTLDLVIANNCDTVIRDVHTDFNTKSDHAYIYFNVGISIESVVAKTAMRSNLRDVNYDSFKTDIAAKVDNYVSNASNGDSENFLNSVNDFNDFCNTCIRDHVTTKQVKIATIPKPKWIDLEFRTARANRRKLFKKWKRTRSDEDRSNFEHARNNTQKMSIDKRSLFYSNAIDNCEKSHKELFQLCKNLLDQSNCTKLPTFVNPKDMANKFNNYFIEKIENIRSNLSPIMKPCIGDGMDTCAQTIMFEFQPVTIDDVRKIMLAKPIKTAPQDPLPAVLLKNSIDELLPALTHLVNLSLSTGSMDGLKDSIIRPLLKKPDLDPEVLKNYRPVNNIVYLSKLIENTVLIQIIKHMDLISAHIAHQSAYKAKHSCETLLLKVTNDIFISFDNSKCVIILLLDLSAAFDTVDHDILLDILWYELGFRGVVFKWFSEFLKNRRQSVSIDGESSDFRDVNFGVPQGSVIGPILFNIYVRNLIKVMEQRGFTVHGYADDHQMLYEFQIDFQVAAVRRAIPLGLDFITNWMNKHFLKLNPSKSQVIIFSPADISKHLVFEQLILSDGSLIKISDQVMDLGVLLDSQLTFSSHITSNIQHGYRLIRNIAGIRKFLSVEHLKTLVNSIIIAKVDNCNSLFYGISSYDSNRLQKFQNSCARLIFGKRKYDHVSGILRELHWLPSEARTYFKILCYVYKSIHGMAPEYLSELIVITRDYNLSLYVPRCKTMIGDRAFSVSGPRLWNALPVELRMMDTLERFKSHLKHLLFSSFREFKFKINIFRS